jgi:hypothetical protein
MVRKPPPGPSGAIRARLNYLRDRKVILDDLIVCLERYAQSTVLIPMRPPPERTVSVRPEASLKRESAA